MAYRWTKEEIRLLKNNYEYVNIKQIARILNRTVNSTVNKAVRLRLRKNILWSKNDDIYLERFVYENDTNLEEAAIFLGRTKGAVATRLTVLRKKNKAMYMKIKWSKKEDEFMLRFYKQMPAHLIAQRLNRTLYAVRSRATVLGLNKTRPVYVHRERILELVKQGFTRTEIADELDVDVKSLSTYLRLHDIYCAPVQNKEKTKAYKRMLNKYIRNDRLKK